MTKDTNLEGKYLRGHNLEYICWEFLLIYLNKWNQFQRHKEAQK